MYRVISNGPSTEPCGTHIELAIYLIPLCLPNW